MFNKDSKMSDNSFPDGRPKFVDPKWLHPAGYRLPEYGEDRTPLDTRERSLRELDAGAVDDLSDDVDEAPFLAPEDFSSPRMQSPSRGHHPQPPLVEAGPLAIARSSLPSQASSSRQQLPPLNQSRVMPLRTQEVTTTALDLLFDLPEGQRAGIQVNKPPKASQKFGSGGAKHPQQKWDAAQDEYLKELMEVAMLQLNRRLAERDFAAITEAHNRKFRGTMSAETPFFERGWNTVHCHAIRAKGYEDFVRDVLPDL